MKQVLITGKGSYIGTKVEKWLGKYPGNYEVDVLDMTGNDWEDFDFHGFDVVYHVAGIAHQKDAPDDLYEQVNHMLAVRVARKASDAGVKHFIFMSSGAVYSQSDKSHKAIVVDHNSVLAPSTAYGRSKLEAERDIAAMNMDMDVAVIRPPMVYGPGAKGNYNRLSSIAGKMPVFPKIGNKRSMIYIDNLCEFIRLLIDSGDSGLFLPQNKEYVNTSELVKTIAQCNGKQIHLTKAFNWVVLLGSHLVNTVNRVFGDFYYKKTDYFNNAYQIIGFEESVHKTETKV